MARVTLDEEQRALLRSLCLPTRLSTAMDKDDWCDIMEILKEEVQLRGIHSSGVGQNAYGLLCTSIYDAMLDAEERNDTELRVVEHGPISIQDFAREDLDSMPGTPDPRSRR